MDHDTFNLHTPYDGSEPVHHLLVSRLNQYQATNLKTLMERNQPCTLRGFIDCYAKALNSVTLYRHKLIVDKRLGLLFDEYDTDKDGVITFTDLPLEGNLLGSDPAGGKTEIVVYSDHCIELQLNLGKHTDVELMRCSNLQHHAECRRYSMCYENDVLLMELNDGQPNPSMDFVARLTGHSAPVLSVIFVPQLKKLFTSSTDRSICGWSQDDRFALSDRARMAAAQTCMTYDPFTQLLLSGGTDGAILLFRTSPKLSHSAFRRVQAHQHDWVLDLQYLPDIDVIASCGVDGNIHFFDHESLAHKSSKNVHGSKGLTKLKYSRGSRTLYTTSSSRNIHLWSPFLPRPTEELPTHEKPVVGLECFWHSPEVITADTTGKICIWDMRKTNVVQVLGAPESVSPIGTIQSFAADPRRGIIVAAGERLSMFVPQKGSYSALMDVPVTAISYCNINKTICAVSGNRVLIFELTTGDHLYSHSLGSVEISAMTYTKMQEVLIGTYEGHVMAITAGSWLHTRKVTLTDAIKFVFDLGSQSRVAEQGEEFCRVLGVTANGIYTHFCYGVASEISGGSAHVFSTGMDALHSASYSPHYALLFLTHKDTFEVWDISSDFRKCSVKLDTWINTVHVEDAVEAAFFATTAGDVMVYHLSTFVPVLRCSLGSAFAPTFLDFDRISWVLTAGTSGATMLLPMDIVIRETERFQRNHVAEIRSAKLINRRFNVDLITDSASVDPQVMPCIDKKTGETTKLLVCSNDDTKKCMDRLLVLHRLQRAAQGARTIAAGGRRISQELPSSPLVGSYAFRRSLGVSSTESFVHHESFDLDGAPARRGASRRSSIDSIASSRNSVMFSPRHIVDCEFLGGIVLPFIPTPTDRCHNTDSFNGTAGPVYCVTEYFDHTSAVSHFSSLMVDTSLSTTDLSAVVAELKWCVHCIASGLDALHSHNYVALFRPAAVYLVNPVYKMFLDGGVWHEGDDGGARLPVTHCPPEGIDCVSPSNDAWLLGLFLYEACVGRPMFHKHMVPSAVESALKGSVLAGATTDAVENAINAKARDPVLINLIVGLLALDATSRLTPKDVVEMVATDHVPRHLTCRPLPTVGDPDALFTVDGDALAAGRSEVALPKATITSTIACEMPTLSISAEFNGMSAHLVVSNPDGVVIGVTPPNNEVAVLWTVGNEEVNAMGLAAEEVDIVAAPVKGRRTSETDAERIRSSLGSRYNPSRYCPFFSELKEVEKTEGLLIEEALPPAYYLQGWHKLDRLKNIDKAIPTRVIERKRMKVLQREKEIEATRHRNDFMSDRYQDDEDSGSDHHFSDNSDSPQNRQRSPQRDGDVKRRKKKGKPSLTQLMDKLSVDKTVVNRRMSPYWTEEAPVDKKKSGRKGDSQRSESAMELFRRDSTPAKSPERVKKTGRSATPSSGGRPLYRSGSGQVVTLPRPGPRASVAFGILANGNPRPFH